MAWQVDISEEVSHHRRNGYHDYESNDHLYWLQSEIQLVRANQ